MVTVFYDSKCGICAREVNYYRKIATSGIFDWQDITALSDAEVKKHGFSLLEGLKKLHVKDNDGSLHIGVEGFILIWKNLNFWRWLAFFVSLPLIKQTAALAYNIFATWRFNNLEHCRVLLKK